MNWQDLQSYGVDSEDALQERIVRAYRTNTPNEDWFRLFHVPNGGKRDAKEALKFKRMGVISGVADLVCLLHEGKVGFIELKYGKNDLSDNQAAFRDFCEKNNYKWALCRTVGEALSTLREWGIYNPNRLGNVFLNDEGRFSRRSSPLLERK